MRYAHGHIVGQSRLLLEDKRLKDIGLEGRLLDLDLPRICLDHCKLVSFQHFDSPYRQPAAAENTEWVGISEQMGGIGVEPSPLQAARLPKEE